MTSPTLKRARVDDVLTTPPYELILPPIHLCMEGARLVERMPAFQAFRDIVCANVAVGNDGGGGDAYRQDLERDERDAEAVRFFDTALVECHNTINVVVGGPATGKMTKLHALVHAASGRARFIAGELFRDELLERADIRLGSPPRRIVVIGGGACDLPPIYEEDGAFSLDFCGGSSSNSRCREITLGGKCVSVALAVNDEEDVVKLASLEGVRINVLRLGPRSYRAPDFSDIDDAIEYAEKHGHEHDDCLSHKELLPQLRAGGPLYAAWRGLETAQKTLCAIL